MCIHPGCKTQAIYNFEGLSKGIYCSKHKKNEMVDVKNKKCIHDCCKRQPIYNNDGETNALYCSEHKKDLMVNVKHKRCIHEECKKYPVFNVSGGTKGLYCSAHKLQGMVSVSHQTCLDCNKRPTFNKECETKALYCLEHKKEGMVDIINKPCKSDGCKTRPTYNKEGNTKALYCSEHKTEDMVDVVNNTCLDCNKYPVFNTEGEKKPLYCYEHKKEWMVNVKSKTCIYESCKKQPTYNNQGETKPLYCSAHKLQWMVDVKHRTCKTYLCSTIVQKKYDGYCRFCYMNLFPDKPVSRNYKTKEYAVVEFVKTKFPEMSWVADKIIQNACSRRRPDLLLDLGYQVIIVEVDENQHIDYDCSCENKRIMELSQDVGHRPIVFIRFNPDEYEKDGTNITSCWGCDKNGLCVVKKSKKNEWTDRLHVLEETISYWVSPENTTSKTIETIQLFYDV